MSGPRHGRNEGGHSIVSAEAGTAGRQGDRGRGRHRGLEGRERRKEGDPGRGWEPEKKINKTVTGGPEAETRRKTAHRKNRYVDRKTRTEEWAWPGTAPQERRGR
jgi:hypothetical protein